MAMRGMGLNKTFTFKKDTVLAALRENRERHAEIVKEAREGWQAAAIKMIKNEMSRVRKLASPRHVSFSLAPPADYTDIYDTFIAQLELAMEDEVELDGDEFRKLMQDKWDWREEFLGTNSAYSISARRSL